MFTDAEDDEELQGGLDTDQEDEEEEGTSQETDELEDGDDDEGESDEGGEKEEESAGALGEAARDYIDQRLDKMADVLSRGTQSMIDKAVDRMTRNVRGKETPWERIVKSFAKSEGIDVEDLPDTSKCKTPMEAFELLVESADKIKAGTSAASSSEFRPKIDDGKGRKEEEEEQDDSKKKKPAKRNEVKSVNVPKKAGRGGTGDTREALQREFNAGNITIQQYSDRMKKIGLDPLRD